MSNTPPWGQQDSTQPGQPPFGYQPPSPHQAPKRKRRTARIVTAAAGGVIVLIIAISAASNHGGHTVTGTGSTTSPTASATGRAGAAAAHSRAAAIGSPLVLTGNNSGEQMTVTVTKVIRHASPDNQFNAAQSGDRLYAVQFRLDDTGSAAYSDAPDNSAVVVDSAGQSYQPSPGQGASGCQLFGAPETIAAGSSGLGCIVFEVPVKASITRVQFTLDSGMGPQTGEWDVALKA